MLQSKLRQSISIFALLLSLSACGQTGGSGSIMGEESYNEKVMSVEETERFCRINYFALATSVPLIYFQSS